MSTEYLFLVPLFIVMYMIAVDRNLADYLYLKLFAEPYVSLQSSLLRTRLLFQLWFDQVLLRHGIIPRRFYRMADQIRSEQGGDPE